MRIPGSGWWHYWRMNCANHSPFAKQQQFAPFIELSDSSGVKQEASERGWSIIFRGAGFRSEGGYGKPGQGWAHGTSGHLDCFGDRAEIVAMMFVGKSQKSSDL